MCVVRSEVNLCGQMIVVGRIKDVKQPVMRIIPNKDKYVFVVLTSLTKFLKLLGWDKFAQGDMVVTIFIVHILRHKMSLNIYGVYSELIIQMFTHD